MDKRWVDLSRLTQEYQEGARNFVDIAHANVRNSDLVVYPCIHCKNLQHHHYDIVYEQLVIKGMDHLYTTWVFHGEYAFSSSVGYKDIEMTETYMMYRDHLFDQEGTFIREVNENIDKEELENIVTFAETLLYPGCTKYTKLSATVALFKHKATHGLFDNGFNELLQILHDMLPLENTLPDSFYSMKKLLKVFDLMYENSHACMKDCCIFRKEYENLQQCFKCGGSRWKVNPRTQKIQKGVLIEVLRYFPINQDLRRMYGITKIAENLRWHDSHKSEDGKMRHPIDSISWDTINKNDRLSHRILEILDLVLLPMILILFKILARAPLIEDLQDLWMNGIEVYDAFTESTFNLKDMLVRHNLDIMHIEKNIFDSIVDTLLDVKGKSNDGLNSHRDLENMCIRKELHPETKGQEARLRGLVQYRWMYPFESKYIKQASEVGIQYGRNRELDNDLLFGGRPISVGKSIILSDEMLQIAHRYILFNSSEVQPYVE
ncbi:hypothetical protein Dsin_008493 [Dipteronia sinensis]|uniref:Transposase-associated domain-containing protein n=1 Tax=Dipteronia sinensis TaxID=43782 RepID=A0AAE0EAQ6_9ROSI|nr:hypothetical protein Dsin_008493 [Dipteronia sinensis]